MKIDMSHKWKKCLLKEVGKIVGGGTPPTKDLRNYENGNIPWITPKDLSNFDKRFIKRGERNITEYGLQNSSAKMLPKNTVLFSSRAPIGYIAIAENEVCTNQGFKSIVPNKSINYLFLYYLLQFKTSEIVSLANGSTFKEISGTNLGNLKIKIPESIEIQEKIASILSALDEKIELNNEINNNLEKQARAIFLNIFLEYLYPTNHSIPLKDCTSSIIKGKTTKYVKYSSLLNLNQKVNKGSYLDEIYYKYLDPTIEIPTEKYIQNGDLLLNSLGQGTLGRIHLWNRHENNIVADQHITIIRAKANVSTSLFLYHLLTSKYYKEYIQNCVMGSTGMQMLNISTIRELPINLPTYVIQTKFTQLITPLYMKMEINRKENIYLNKIKKLIIPKLLSGELDVTKLK